MRKVFVSFLLLGLSIASTSIYAASAAPSPKITWDCKLMRFNDDQGPFVFFDPRAQVTWYGKTLKYQALYWSSRDTRLSQAAQNYGTVTAKRNGSNFSNLDVTHKFYNGNETEYKKIQLTITDLAGKKTKQTCTWDGPVANGW